VIYKFLKQIIKVSLFFFFKKIVVTGRKNIPDTGPLILVANHPNTFMDPLLIAAITSNRMGFVANASIFVNKFIAKIFRYFHVIPIYRKKDIQPGEKPDNRLAFSKCHDYLEQRGTLLIFPEGTSYYELKLREIKTGTARIALSYEELKGFEGNLKIIPIALDYSDSIQFRSMVSITVCKPLMVSDYKQTYESIEFDAVLQLTGAIRTALAEIIPHTTGKEQEQFLLEAHQFYTAFYATKADLDENPKLSLVLRNQVSKALQFLQKENLTLYLDTQKKLLLFFKLLKEERITPAIVSNSMLKKNKPFVYGISLLQFLVLLPAYIFGLCTNYLPYMITPRIFKTLKLDISYRAPVQMLTGLITFPFFYGMIIWLYRTYISSDFWHSLILFCLMPITGYIAMFYYAEMKRFRRMIRYIFFVKESKKQSLLKLQSDILRNMEMARKQYSQSFEVQEGN